MAQSTTDDERKQNESIHSRLMILKHNYPLNSSCELSPIMTSSTRQTKKFVRFDDSTTEVTTLDPRDKNENEARWYNEYDFNKFRVERKKTVAVLRFRQKFSIDDTKAVDENDDKYCLRGFERHYYPYEARARKEAKYILIHRILAVQQKFYELQRVENNTTTTTHSTARTSTILLVNKEYNILEEQLYQLSSALSSKARERAIQDGIQDEEISRVINEELIVALEQTRERTDPTLLRQKENLFSVREKRKQQEQEPKKQQLQLQLQALLDLQQQQHQREQEEQQEEDGDDDEEEHQVYNEQKREDDKGNMRPQLEERKQEERQGQRDLRQVPQQEQQWQPQQEIWRIKNHNNNYKNNDDDAMKHQEEDWILDNEPTIIASIRSDDYNKSIYNNQLYDDDDFSTYASFSIVLNAETPPSSSCWWSSILQNLRFSSCRKPTYHKRNSNDTSCLFFYPISSN